MNGKRFGFLSIKKHKNTNLRISLESSWSVFFLFALIFASLVLCLSDPVAISQAAFQPVTFLKYEKIAWVWSVAAGDIDGDGTMEIVAGTEGGLGDASPVVTVLNNEGTALWTFSVPETVNAWTVVTSDIDEDGSDEIVAGKYYYGDSMSSGNVFAIDGDKSILWSYKTDGWINSIVVDDINRDGKKEVLVAGENDNRVYCLTNEGDLLWSVSLAGDLRNRNALVVGDVDGDSEKEVVVGTCNTSALSANTVTVVKNSGIVLWSRTMPDWVESIAVGDINGDGISEVIAGLGLRMTAPDIYCGEPLHVLSNTGEFLWSFPIAKRVFDIAIGDIDGDGSQEIVAGSEESKVYVLRHNRTPLWVYSTEGAHDFVHEVEARDVDGDGDKEVVAASYDYNVYVIGSGGKLLWKSDVGLYTELAFADMNNDGVEDLIAGVRKPSGDPGPSNGIIYAFITAIQEGRTSTARIIDPVLVSPTSPMVIDALEESGVKVFITEISSATTVEIKKIGNSALTESSKFNSVILDSPISISSDVKVSGVFTIRIYYSLPEGIDAGSLTISCWDKNAVLWVEVESVVNTTENYVETTTNHLSYWVVTGKPVEKPIWLSWLLILVVISVVFALTVFLLVKRKRKCIRQKNDY